MPVQPAETVGPQDAALLRRRPKRCAAGWVGFLRRGWTAPGAARAVSTRGKEQCRRLSEAEGIVLGTRGIPAQAARWAMRRPRRSLAHVVRRRSQARQAGGFELPAHPMRSWPGSTSAVAIVVAILDRTGSRRVMGRLEAVAN